MTENTMDPKVDEFLSESSQWKDEFVKLRKIILGCQLTEELKWGKPCYSYNKANIVLIHGFKNYCALLFIKGALLKDPDGILVQQTENVQAARQIRFTDIEEINEMEPIIKKYVFEAIEIEKSGLEIDFKKTAEFKIPDELSNKFNQDVTFKTAFEKLTPGRQRAYILFFSAPKQSKTRESRIEKYYQTILNGKGLND